METPTTLSQAQMIADIFEETRKLTKFYLSKVDPAWAEWQPEVEGTKLNSAYWIVAHLVWAEHALMVASVGGPTLDLPWLNHYQLGNDGSLHEGRPSYSAMLEQLNEMHKYTVEFVRTLTDDQLDEPADVSTIQWNTTKRKVLYHAIRHEGTHVGHLGWLCKIKGIKTV